MPDLKPRPCPFCGADIKTTGKIMRADGKIVWKHGYVGCAIDGSIIVDVETWNSCPREEDKYMDINLKKVTKDKLIEMLTEERDEKKRRISELESAVKVGLNREIDLRRKVDEFRDLYFEQCDKVKALREHPWKNLWSWLKGRFS